MMNLAHRPSRTLLLSLFCCLFALLSGCGGGGGGSAVGGAGLPGGDAPVPAATVTVTGRVNLPDADKSGVLVSLARAANGQSLAVARMLSGETVADPELLERPDRQPSRAQAESIYFALTDAAGAYSIPNVPVGEYVVEARRGGSLVGSQRSLSLTGVSRQVEVEEIFLTPVGVLAGTVAFNPALSDRSGVLCYVEGTSLLAVTDASGAYRIAAVPFNSDGSPRSYQVTFQRAGFTKAQSVTVTLTTAGATVTVPLVTLQMAGASGGAALAISTAAGTLHGMERYVNAASVSFAVTVPSGSPAPIYMSWPVFSSGATGGVTGAPALALNEDSTEPVEPRRAPQRSVAFGAFEPFAATKTLSLPEGAFRLQARFTMADGQTVVADLPELLVVDRTQPDPIVFAPWLDDQPEGGAPDKLYGNELMLRVNARDLLSRDVEVQVLLDAVVVAPFHPVDPTRFLVEPLVIPGTADATHTIQATFRDRAGNARTTQFTIQKLLPKSYMVDSFKGFLPREPIPVANLIYNGRIVYADGAFEHTYPGSITAARGGIVDGIYTPPTSGNDTLSVNPLHEGAIPVFNVELDFDGLEELDMRIVGTPSTTVGTPLPLASTFAPVARYASGREQRLSFGDLTYLIPTSMAGGPVGTIAPNARNEWEFTPYYAGVHDIVARHTAGGVTVEDTFSIYVPAAPRIVEIRVNGAAVSPGVAVQTLGFATISWTLSEPCKVTIFYGTRPVADRYALYEYEKLRVEPGYAADGMATLYDLSPGTMHYFRIAVENGAGIETISDEYRLDNGYVDRAQPVVLSMPDGGYPQNPAGSIPRGIDTLLYAFKFSTGAGEAVVIEDIAISATSPDQFSITSLRNLRLLHASSGALMGSLTSAGLEGGIMTLRFAINRPFNPSSIVHFSLHGLVNEAEGKRLQFAALPTSKVRGATSGSPVTVNASGAQGPELVIGSTPVFNPSFNGLPGATTIFGGTYNDGTRDIHHASISVDPVTGAAAIFPEASGMGRALIAQTPGSDTLSPYGEIEFYCDTNSGWSFLGQSPETAYLMTVGEAPVTVILEHTSGKNLIFMLSFTENTSLAEGVAERYIMQITDLTEHIN